MENAAFQNLPVALTALPKVEQLPWQALSPRYTHLNLVLHLMSTVLLTLVWPLLYWQSVWPLSNSWQMLVLWGGSALSLFSVWGVLYCYLAYPRKAYALREHDLSFRHGLFWQKSVTQPILRIQHIELKRGPIERHAGLATLQVFSAGGALHTFEIPGLPLADAERIRELILQHKTHTQYD